MMGEESGSTLKTCMFEIFANDILVGHSALEFGDPPMGVAFGKFIAVERYREIRHACRTNHADQSALGLNVKAPSGTRIPCAGVGILDFLDDPGDDSLCDIEVAVYGIAYPLYGDLFPEHVSDYEERFRET